MTLDTRCCPTNLIKRAWRHHGPPPLVQTMSAPLRFGSTPHRAESPALNQNPD